MNYVIFLIEQSLDNVLRHSSPIFFVFIIFIGLDILLSKDVKTSILDLTINRQRRAL